MVRLWKTFQIILYDQDFHYSSLGDGPIKIQYHTYNNVDSQSGSQSRGTSAPLASKITPATRGLEYTFNNIYPTAAATLGNNKSYLYEHKQSFMYELR
jgi:hypothetical protein